MQLAYLTFDFSDDESGRGSFDAMASVPAARVQALLDEVARVLAWAHDRFGAAGGDDGEAGEWDYELQAQEEVATALDAAYDARAGRITLRTGRAGEPRTTVSLTLTGSPSFCEAFREAFAVDD